MVKDLKVFNVLKVLNDFVAILRGDLVLLLLVGEVGGLHIIDVVADS